MVNRVIAALLALLVCVVVLRALVLHELMFCKLVDRAVSGLWEIVGLVGCCFMCSTVVLLLFGWFYACLLLVLFSVYHVDILHGSYNNLLQPLRPLFNFAS